jgi:hypothetical protein
LKGKTMPGISKGVWETKYVTETRTTDVEGVGRIREENGNLYRWVKNAEASATLAKGTVAHHSFADTSDALKNVTLAATANLGFMAGTVQATDGIPAQNYGWIMISGIDDSALVFASQTTAKTAGITLKGVNTAAYADTDNAMGTAPIYTRNLLLLEAVATVTTGAGVAKKVFVNCI